MSKSKFIIYGINVLLVFLMIYRSIEINDDKAFLIVAVYYPFLFALNLILAGIFRLLRKSIFKVFLQSCILLLILLLPVLFICAQAGLIGQYRLSFPRRVSAYLTLTLSQDIVRDSPEFEPNLGIDKSTSSNSMKLVTLYNPCSPVA